MKKTLLILPLFIFMVAAILVGCSQSYTIRFNTNCEAVVSEIKVADNKDIVLPQDPVRDGYKFEGWYLDEELTTPLSLSYVKDNKDNLKSKIIYVYAKWSPNEITVNLDYGIAKEYLSSGLVDEISLTYGTEIYNVLPRPYTNGYVFKGWFTMPNGKGELIEQDTKLTNSKNHTLYAYWAPQSGILLFDARIGGISYVTTSSDNKVNFSIDSATGNVDLTMYLGGLGTTSDTTFTSQAIGGVNYFVSNQQVVMETANYYVSYLLEGTTIVPYLVSEDKSSATKMADSNFDNKAKYLSVDLKDGCTFVPGIDVGVCIDNSTETPNLQAYSMFGIIDANGMYECDIDVGTQIGDITLEQAQTVKIALEEDKAIGYVEENGILVKKYEFTKNEDGTYKLNNSTKISIVNPYITSSSHSILTENKDGYIYVTFFDEDQLKGGSFVLDVVTSGIIYNGYNTDYLFRFNESVVSINNNQFKFNNVNYTINYEGTTTIQDANGNNLTLVNGGSYLFKNSDEYYFKIDGGNVIICKLGTILYFDEQVIIEEEEYSYEAIKSSLLASIGIDTITRRYNYGDTIGKLPTPDIPAGMQFVGWYSQGENGKKYESGSIFDSEGALLLVPRFEPITVTLELNVNNSQSQQPKGELKYDYGSIVKISELPKYAVNGFSLIGWNTNSEADSGITNDFVIFENMKLYAIWKEVKGNAYNTYFYLDNSNVWTIFNISAIDENMAISVDNDSKQFSLNEVTYTLNIEEGSLSNSVDETKITTSITEKNSSGQYKQLVFDINGEIYVYYNGYMIKSPSKQGYTFAYWTSSNSNVQIKGVYDLNTTLQKDLVLYAAYKTEKVSVVYQVDGSTYSTAQVSYNSNIISNSIRNPQKVGYKFVGWIYNLTDDGYVIINDETTVEDLINKYGYTTNITVSSLFISDSAKLDIIFKYEGEEVTRKSIGFGEKIGYIQMPELVGKYSLGWFITINNKEYQITKDTIWNKESPWGIETTTLEVELKTTLRLYPVVIRPNRGTTESVLIGDYAIYGTYYYPDLVSLKSQLAREGYELVGLNTKADGTGYSVDQDNGVQVNGAINLYAQWKALTQTIYFVDSETGSQYDSFTKEIEFGQPVGPFNYLTVEGKGFAGWAIKNTVGSEATESEFYIIINENYKFTSYSETQTLYAVWDNENYYVRFLDNLESGVDLGITYSKTISKNFTDYILYKPILDPIREDYEFAGWVDAFGEPFEFGQKITGDVYVYATWIRTNILLDLGIGQSEKDMTRIAVELGEELGELPTPTRAGFDFMGWYTGTDGTGNLVNSYTIWDGMFEKIYAYWQPVANTGD